MGIRSLSASSISTGVKRSDFWDQSAVYVPPAYESIATTTVGSGGTTTITFSSIPSTYKHLQIRYIGRNTTAADAPILRFNSDSGSNYARHKLAGDGATVSAAAATTATYMGIGDVPATANSFAAGVIDVLDYQNTSKYKTVRSLTGYDLNGSGNIDFRSNLWQSTSAVTDISIAASSNNFAQYSSFALYGIKG